MITISVISNAAHAHSSTISLSMQKSTYYPNDVVVINGTTASNQLVTVEIKNPFDKTVFEKSLLPTAKGQFSISYVIDSYPTKGTYVVIAKQNSETVASYFGVYSKPSIRLEAIIDNLNYQNTEQPHVTILDLPESVIDLKVLDNSQIQKFEDKIKTTPDGRATYDLNITSYSTGVYDLLVTSSTGKAKLGFAVGLIPSGPRMSLNTDKNSYLPGDNVTILGAWNPNTISQLSLIDSAGVSVQSIQTFSDKTGHFSSSDFKIPSTAISGSWKIEATSGFSHNSLEIKVNSPMSTNMIQNNTNATIPTYGGGGPMVIITLYPLEQFKSGIPARSITCQKDFVLVIKSEDGSPACVTQKTASVLIQRGYAKETVSIPNPTSNVKSMAQNYTNIASDIIPGHMRRGSCGGPAPAIQSSSKIINATGFVGVYHDTIRYYANPDDYVLKPGHTGTITYMIDAGPTPKLVPFSPIKVPKNFNVTNYAIFYHEITSLGELAKHPGVTIHDHYDYDACFTRPTGEKTCLGEIFGGKNSIEAYVTDHVGVNATFDPAFEALQFNDTHSGQSSQIIRMTISSDANATRGTYMVILSPEECLDGEIFLLTIGEQPYHE